MPLARSLGLRRMATLRDLNDRQRATLQLLLKQGKSYDEIAGLLRLNTSAVQGRAHEAVAALGPRRPDIGDDRRHEIADYLLGQQTASGRAATREYLEDSGDGRGWARAVAGALRPIGGDGLPEIPAEPAEVDEAFEALDRRTARQEEVRRDSQLGTKILFGVVGLAVAIVLIVVLGVFDSNSPKPKTTTVTRTAPTDTTPAGAPQLVLQGTMRPPKGSHSGASAETAIVRYASNDVFKLLIAAKGMTVAPKGTAYGVWLYTSASQELFIGFPKSAVTDAGKLEVVADLTPQTPTYQQVFVTRERVTHPSKPGKIVLRARFTVAKSQQAPAQTPTQTQTQPGP